MRIDQIVVGERLREDVGDLDELVASIRVYGLLHPIVVDADRRLVAGERRLRACRVLGWEHIPTKDLGTLTGAERRAIELEENLRRKDLTAYERSKALVQYVDATAAILAEDKVPVARRGPRGGVPKTAPTEREVAERVGVPRQTIQHAKKHVAAVTQYPELAPMEQGEALQFARALDAAPPEVREAVKPDVQAIAYTRRQTPAAVREVLGRIEASGGVQQAKFEERCWRELKAACSGVFALDAEAFAAAVRPDEAIVARHCAASGRAWLDRFETALGRGLRLVEGGE